MRFYKSCAVAFLLGVAALAVDAQQAPTLAGRRRHRSHQRVELGWTLQGKLSDDGSKLEGRGIQNGLRTPFVLVKVALPH
jgi:hypothetical protein